MIKKGLILTTKEWLINSHKKSGNKTRLKHLIRTMEWLRILSPQATTAQLIAALTHDMERAFPPKEKGMSDKNNLLNRSYLLWHSKRSAKIIENFLKAIKTRPEIIKEAKRLISLHEFGGDEASNLLKDADSLANLEIFGPKFVEWTPKIYSWQETEMKLRWMFTRITHPQAKKIARKFFKENLKNLKVKRNNHGKQARNFK